MTEIFLKSMNSKILMHLKSIEETTKYKCIETSISGALLKTKAQNIIAFTSCTRT